MKGSFYKRGTTWSFMLETGKDPLTGKRKQKGKGGFRTKKEAQDAAAELQVELKKGIYVEDKGTTFEKLSQDWLISYSKHGRAKKNGTIRIRKYEREKLLPHFKMLVVNTITEEMYQDALIKLKDEGIGFNTLSGIHSTGGMIFEFGLKKGSVKIDPTKTAYVPKDAASVEDLENDTHIPKYLEKEELFLFLETARLSGLDRDYEIFRTLAYTGMRVGELCALKFRDIDFENGIIKVNKTLYNPNNNYSQFILNTPKTKSSVRDIEVEEEIINDLKNLKSFIDLEKSNKPDTYFDQDFVFCKRGQYAGYPEVIKMIQLRMARLLKISGLNQELTPHSLRHTHTSLLAESEVSLEQIMHRLGHSDDAITRKIYLHITKPKKKEASQKFGELMRGLKNSTES